MGHGSLINGRIKVDHDLPLSVGVWMYNDLEPSSVIIGKSGSIDAAQFAIHHAGPGLVVDNAGLMTADIGIGGQMSAAKITNSGRIIADTTAVDWSNSFDGGEIANSGILRAKEGPAIAFTSRFSLEETVAIRNTGTIETRVEFGDAILLNSHEEDTISIVNRGTIKGNVTLGDGTNTFTNYGKILGTLYGGVSDDRYYVHSNMEIVDYDGHDIVHATVDLTLGEGIDDVIMRGKKNIDATGNHLDNEMTGNARDNVIKGGLGADIMNGGAGNDKLTGGEGGDVFIYADGFDKDVITDLGVSDALDLRGVKSAVDLEAVMNLAKEMNGDIVIDFSGGDILRVRDVTMEDFTDWNILFYADAIA